MVNLKKCRLFDICNTFFSKHMYILFPNLSPFGFFVQCAEFLPNIRPKQTLCLFGVVTPKQLPKGHEQTKKRKQSYNILFHICGNQLQYNGVGGAMKGMDDSRPLPSTTSYSPESCLYHPFSFSFSFPRYFLRETRPSFQSLSVCFPSSFLFFPPYASKIRDLRSSKERSGKRKKWGK